MRSLLQLFARRSAVDLRLSSPAVAAPASGLVIVEGWVKTKAPLRVTLRATVVGAEDHPFETPLALGPVAQKVSIGVHSHLLPDGRNSLRLELIDAQGERVGEQTLNLAIHNPGALAASVAASLKATGVPLIVSVCDSTTYDYADPALTAWFDRPDAEAHIAGLETAGAVAPAEAEALRHFVREGYLVLPDLIGPEHLGRLVAALDDAVEKHIEGYEWGASQRIHNLHNHYPAIRELWLHPQILRMLQLIFGAPAKPCQTLSYVFGSEQQYHQDTIHLTPFPAGYMCGVWTALEDVQPDSGELIVFPGSHRERRVYMHEAGAAKVTDEVWTEFGEKVAPLWGQMLEKGGYAREVYRPKAGAVLIWHENLMHAGMRRKDRDKSRRSIVGHYFAQGAVVYYDSSGMPGHLYEGALPAAE